MASNTTVVAGDADIPKANGGRAGSMMESVIEASRFCAPIFLMLAIWEIASRTGAVNQVLMPPPTAVFLNLLRLMQNNDGQGPILLWHTGISFMRIAAGYGLAAVFCTILGVLMGVNKRVYAFFDPIVTVLMPIPTLAWVPIVILWLGMSNATIIFVIFISGLFPIVYNSAAGVRGISKKTLWAAEIMGASKHKTFIKVLLPAALPSIITGHILAVSNGWRALVGAEMLAGSGYGLGYMIFDARTFMDTETVYGGIIMIALLGLLIEKGLFKPLRRFTIERWGTVRAA